MVRNSLRIVTCLLLVSGLMAVWAPLHAQQDVYMKIQSGGFQAVGIEVPPFESGQPTDLTNKLREVLVNDLNLSGFFIVVNQLGSDEPVAAGSSYFREHHPESGAAVRIQGKISFDGNSLELQGRLEELPAQQAIFNKTFKASLESARWAAHQLADEISYYVIGERGIAASQLAFSTGNGGRKEIGVVDYDGYDFREVTRTRSLNLSPCWSPDGTQLAFTSYVSGTPDLVRLIVPDGKMTPIPKQGGMQSAPAWSPDGKKLAYTLSHNGNSDIYTWDVSGGRLHKLTSSPAIDSSPSWSPNGNQIVFTSDRSGSPQVYIMDAEGGNVRRLTFNGNYNDSPVWSPRGDFIAYVSREEGGFHVFTVDVNGENVRRLTDGAGNNENPSWSPDGLKIAFASNREGAWDIYVMNWDGSHLRRVTTTGGNVAPEWSPRLKAPVK